MIEDADGGNKGCLEFEDFMKVVKAFLEKNFTFYIFLEKIFMQK